MGTSNAANTRSVDLAQFASGGQGQWELDPAASTVEFRVKHFWGAITVHGRFHKLSGSGTVDEDGTIAGQLRIDTNSLSTNNKQRDKHLLSSDFFDADHH